tara:strand:+ start:349 stop:1926 length:1578 start_codon:yes stop_codon:yes gene_type:complete
MNRKKFLSDIKKLSSSTGVRRKKLRLFISVLLTNLTVIFDLIVIVVFASLFSDSVSYENIYINWLIKNNHWLPLIVFFRFLFFYIEKLNLHTLKEDINRNLKLNLMENIYKSGRYSMSDATFFITSLSSHTTFFYHAFSQVLTSLIQLSVYLIFLILLSIEAVGFLVLCSLILFLPTRYFLVKARFYVDQSYKADKSIYSTTQRIYENITLIKILKTKNFEFDRFLKVLNKYRLFQVRNYQFSTLNSILPNFFITFIISILISFFTIVEYITLEFIGATLRVVQTIGQLSTAFNNVINSYVHVEKYVQILDDTSNLDLYEPEFNLVDHTNAIKVENLTFNYFGSTKNLFENFDINIEKNKHTVITGSNGVGKSTLVSIVAGVLRPTTGKVSLFSNKIAYVGAVPLIIPGTLRDNLCYGSEKKYNDNKLIDIVNEFMLTEEKVNLNDEITNKNLSSGQIQKISFMRAILSEPEILILDESTANLDDNSKTTVFKILEKLDLTILNVTHNPEDFKYDKNINLDQIEK